MNIFDALGVDYLQEAEKTKKALLEAGVTEQQVAQAAVNNDRVRGVENAISSLLMPAGDPVQAPKTWKEKAKENYGTGGYLLRRLAQSIPLLTPTFVDEMIIPEMKDRGKFQEQQAAHEADKEKRAKAAEASRYLSALKNDDPNDDAAAWFGLDQMGVSSHGMDAIKGPEPAEDRGRFGNQTQTERMLSLYHDPTRSIADRNLAAQTLNKPYNITTPEGTFTYSGLGLPMLGEDGKPVKEVQGQPSSTAPKFTKASSAGEREKSALIDLIGDADKIYDMQVGLVDVAANETLPPWLAASVMSDTGAEYAAYKSSLTSAIGKIFSGAVLNETEIDNVMRGYIPQPGESERTRMLKKKRFDLLRKAYERDPENFDGRAYYNSGAYKTEPVQYVDDVYGDPTE